MRRELQHLRIGLAQQQHAVHHARHALHRGGDAVQQFGPRPQGADAGGGGGRAARAGAGGSRAAVAARGPLREAGRDRRMSALPKVNAAKKPNGLMLWHGGLSPKSAIPISARISRSILKADCKHADGKMKRASGTTEQNWWLKK